MTRGKIITITVVFVIIIILVGTVLAFDLYPFSKTKEDVSDSYFNKTMDIKEVVSGDIVNSIANKGTMTTIDTADVKLQANFKIKEINVLSGSRVEKNDEIATIDKESLKNEYVKIQEAITASKIELGRMKPTYDYINIRLLA